ncbi:MAG: putative Na+/H+ antiporter [Bdellovibrionales bacterium]|nr:putative Na+/H+ antiporter [Bdellovibrionales bacterium]
MAAGASVSVELPQIVQYVATGLFAVAILHTFLVKKFAAIAHRYPEGSVGENFFHLLSEIEVVFGFWAGVFILFLVLLLSPAEAIQYVDTRNFTEPLFVFVIMTVCATKPVLDIAGRTMGGLARLIPGNRDMAEFIVILIVGPLIGSLITEPAAMTVCALMLLDKFFRRTDDMKFKYAMIGLLFVNISIGGTLTSYAAPPVLMVAKTWNWDSTFMFTHFGWKAIVACSLSTALVAWRFRKSIFAMTPIKESKESRRTPLGIDFVHLAFVALIVLTSHYPSMFIGLFLFFIGVAAVTKEYQEPLKLKESLLVGFFLAGLVVLGGPQGWWLQPLLAKLESLPLFLGSTALTAVTDNAALTYLGSLVPGLSDESKYALVAGAVTGGGLTVIANAPNPAGFGILNGTFGDTGISPLGLLLGALPPTIIAAAMFWLT